MFLRRASFDHDSRVHPLSACCFVALLVPFAAWRLEPSYIDDADIIFGTPPQKKKFKTLYIGEGWPNPAVVRTFQIRACPCLACFLTHFASLHQHFNAPFSRSTPLCSSNSSLALILGAGSCRGFFLLLINFCFELILFVYCLHPLI